MNSEALGRKDFLLVSLVSKLANTAKTFGDMLAKHMEIFEVIVSAYTNPRKENIDIIFKESITYVAAGTTCPLL